MREYLPLLIVGAIIGLFTLVFVVAYAREKGIPEERMHRAMIFSSLLTVYQKEYIGKLSAFCGAVTAAAGCGAAITWLHGGNLENICDTIANTVANVGGMVCDGAKSSCAAKIATAVDCAITAWELSRGGHVFQPGEGLVMDSVEDTIESVGRMGREGMQATDLEILQIMLRED